MRNQIELDIVNVPDYFTQRKDLTLEEAYLLSVIYQLVKKGERIDYSNYAFSVQMKRDERSVSRWLTLLQKRKYIFIKGRVQNRLIFITNKTRQVESEYYELKKALQKAKGGK